MPPPDPQSFHLLLLDNGAFHKAQALYCPPNVGLIYLPPYAPELNPTERLWRDLKDWLATYQPDSLDTLSTLLCGHASSSTCLPLFAP